MTFLAPIRDLVADHLWYRTLVRHRSRMGRIDAPRYTAFLRRCQHACRVSYSAQAKERAAVFERNGFVSFHPAAGAAIAATISAALRRRQAAGEEIWDGVDRFTGDVASTFPELAELFDGEVGDFLRAVYTAEFKIYYGLLYRSLRRKDKADGSQLWHADGGPGTCINLMFYLTDATDQNGAMECLPWSDTLEVFRSERKALRALQRHSRADKDASREERRNVKSTWYHQEVERVRRSSISQPVGGPGMVLAFRNNLLHKGGFPNPGQERMVCIFHIYPGKELLKFSHYRTAGMGKTDSYPMDPAW